MKILIVEDDAVISLSTQTILQNYEILPIARTEKEAIEFARKHKPDIILMDVYLDYKEAGIIAAHEINGFLDVPIIFISGYADKQIISKAKYTKPYGYLVKPVKNSDLKIAIEMALYKHSSIKSIGK